MHHGKQIWLSSHHRESESRDFCLYCISLLHLTQHNETQVSRNPPGDREDEEDYNHRAIPRQWRQGACLGDIDDVAAGNRDTQVAKRQRLYLKHYYNAPAGATAWQRDMI